MRAAAAAAALTRVSGRASLPSGFTDQSSAGDRRSSSVYTSRPAAQAGASTVPRSTTLRALPVATSMAKSETCPRLAASVKMVLPSPDHTMACGERSQPSVSTRAGPSGQARSTMRKRSAS
jgi:hypothetical protein